MTITHNECNETTDINEDITEDVMGSSVRTMGCEVVLCLVYTMCAVTVVCIPLHIPRQLNKGGQMIFNASCEDSRIYSLDLSLSDSNAHRFVSISSLDGLVALKSSLVCSSDHIQHVCPFPLMVSIRSDSFRVTTSATKVTIISLDIYFSHESCPTSRNYTSNSHSLALIVVNDDRVCAKKSQFLAHLPLLMPHSLKSQCLIDYKPSITAFTGDDNNIGIEYSVERNSSDLVSLSEKCIDLNHFTFLLDLSLDCKPFDNKMASNETRIRDEMTQVLEITFMTRDSDCDQYLETFKSRLKNNRIRSRSRRESTNSEPFFDKSLYIVSVAEEKEKGYIVTTMTASDRETTDLLYQMSAVLDARSQSMFSIDSSSGVISTTARLDRELMDVHYLRITAVDNGVPARSGTTTLQINVNDENDHSPVFELASYDANIRESSPISTTVLTVRATDADSGVNSDIEYSIVNPTGVNEAFKIDSHSGIITTRAALDRESVDFYSLTIQASDSGSINTRRYSQTAVAIKILDDNDNYPQFSERSYSVQIPEDINYLNRPVIARVSAYDSDEGLNSALRYSIIGGNTQGMFQMDSLNGEVSVMSPLDYETSHSYRLVLRAQDAGSPPRSNTTQLLINIIDKNDNEPKFYTSLFQETVLENSAIGSSIVRVQAYDADDGSNSAINYLIRNSNIVDMPIAIDNQTGWVFTTRELDWEESSLYEFIVVAQDNGSPPLSATANVIIRVQDLNDNLPVFAPKLYETTVSEVDAVGSPIISVTATDKDENSRLIFQISSGNTRGRFSIITQNGQGLISIAQPLDYKAEKKFVLSVTATDSGGKSDTATVYINVTDANTHRPVIEKTPYAISIPEDTPSGTTVLVIEATDGDVGENARITFQMDDVKEFRIDSTSGAIVTTRALDREETGGYTIVVSALDNGIPPLADITNVEIEIADVNDNSPEFVQNVYTVSITEDSPIGSSVVQISAIDRDLGLNGQLRYTFSGGNDGSATFVIDPTSGIIRSNKVLDREMTPKYQLIALGVDRGVPSMSSSVIINVVIEDCKCCTGNDNPPRFESEKIRLYVPENSPIGWTVGSLNAIDPDDGPNAKIEYSIVGGPDMMSFTLKSRPSDNGAELISGIDMDYESPKKVYHIIVRASSLPLRNDVDVEIHVTDVNDHPPLLRHFSIIFNNFKNYFPLNHVIGRIPAFDADVADRLKYKFVSGNNANLLILNETNGNIKLSPSLNTNVPMRALFSVSVSDGINEATATCHLVVNLVTEAMLFNSVTIRLNKISQKTFLSSLFDRFLDGLAAIIPSPKENIVIFNTQDDLEDDSLILNISFSARLPDNRDSESYYSPQYLQERVYLSRALLTKLTGLEVQSYSILIYTVLAFDDNLCVREPCLNFEECLSVLKFGNASDFVSSDTILFRSINPVNTFACRCPKGFQGMQHKYECDTEINLCFSGPCLNGGVCVHQEGSYVCLCNEGFAGKNCEINFALDHCRSGLCKSDSHCVNSRSMKIKATLGISSFQCLNCSLEEWSTSLCELKTRSFSKGSYLTFSSLRQRHRLNIRLTFATRLSNALLLYNGRYNEKHDFIALEIIDSKVVFSFSVGANISKVTVQSAMGVINDGKWHQIEVNYLNRTATLKLDNCDDALLRAVHRNQLSSKYMCANTTVLDLEPRCSDKMQTCYRFLDLTGPLQIGGLPQLPTRFQTTHKDFVGCITQLYIDHQMVDLNSYVANNGTVSGCAHKHRFCQSQPCLNGGTCRERWGSYVCDCPNTYTGQDCSHSNEVVKQFRGDSFLSFTPRLRPLSLPWIISFQFKTIMSNGLLLRLQLGHNSVVAIQIHHSIIKYTYNLNNITIDDAFVNDGKWHQIEANWMTNGLRLSLDFGQYVRFQDFESDINGLYIAKVTVGGLEPNEHLNEENQFEPFVGCIQALDVGNSKDSWLRPSLQNNVDEGCIEGNPCLSNPCPLNGKCIVKAFSEYECKCNSGFAGDVCTPICDLNPCAFGSTCLLWNNSRGYKCQCDRHHTGLLCEDLLPKTCPSNWWGYPICGPCNCDTTKGYDGNCNKTSGECSCEQNHFQPLNSDVCFKCDCYGTGSYMSRCDPTSGQCKCRPGVIGRRCDSCPSPFAEVTLRGCEVIYDGCPRAFNEQVWWERTLFNAQAVQSCPSGSIGSAVRQCSETNGWMAADLFDCTSNAFIELSDQSTLLEKNEFLITSHLSIKISNDLINAINNTETLYGSDILIAYRLIRHMINNELKQKGLNLTHKQDRHFIRNLVESTDQLWDMPKSLHSYVNTSALLHSSVPSIYLDMSLPLDSSPSVSIPKYNNFPIRKQNIDDITKVFIPLKTLAVKTIEEIASNPMNASFDRQPKADTAIVGYAIFSSLGQILPPIVDSSVRHRFGQPIRANSPIFLLTIKPLNGTKFVNKSIVPKLHFRMRTLDRNGRSSPQCAYWAFNSNANSRSKSSSGQTRGRWSSKGCEVKGFHPTNKYRLSYDYVNCSCDRAIGVAVLMDLTANEYFVSESLAQVVVSYFGSIVSLLLLAFTLFVLTAIRGIETNSNSIHRHLVLCLLLAEFIFLVALRIRSTLVQKEFGCKMTAISLQYLFMCLFSWSCVQSIHLYRMLTEIRDINHGPMKFYYFIGYVIPAIIVGLTVGVRADQYGNYIFCWLSIYESVVWSLVAPICIAIIVSISLTIKMRYIVIINLTLNKQLVNLVVFLLALQASVQIKETVSDYGNLKTLLWLSIILLPLLGSVWILALLSVNDTLEELHYGFSLMSLISSIYIFVGYCLINHRVRHNIRVLWARLRGRKGVYVDDSLSGTRTSVASRSAPTFHNSSFDVLHRNMTICASSTTSRSTVTKTSSTAFRHKRRHTLNAEHSESDSDVSYDRSLDLASSHSSDEDDNSCAPKQNRINAEIQQNHNIFGDTSVNSSLFARPLHVSDAQHVYPKWSHIASHSVPSPSQTSPITECGPFLSSRPYSRSNILAMTAGLSADSLAAHQNITNNELNALNTSSQAINVFTSSSHNSESLFNNNDNNTQHLEANINLSEDMDLNIKYDNNGSSKAHSISEILIDEREVIDHNSTSTLDSSKEMDPIQEDVTQSLPQQSIISSVDEEAAVNSVAPTPLVPINSTPHHQ
ncbi:unnamed protein product [Medioppia subpectinata]|uniref:Uncharacterized protein n=1 Tax=Medioppia subpectinata TaxID=1979941 RepID=A0A7R9KHW3_9ACAR|nr:unnamed protein product [Medioppia subpectinata]CAG2102625.1 unnamed protein product [Medioppia subpectinata]